MSLWQRLTPLYDKGEAQAIVRLVLEQRFGMSLADILCGAVDRLSATEQETLESIMQRLERAEPVQYVLGSCLFCGRPFHVEPGVLIPRPETEELVRWVADDIAGSRQRILDIGTGSGCIAISIALQLADADVEAWDISDDALRVAAHNARQLGAHVRFARHDILSPFTSGESPFDIIVSNPPYICDKEKSDMDRNVLEYEPDGALFVPDDNPLLFYDAIAHFAMESLENDGLLYFEINPLYADALKHNLLSLGFRKMTVREDAFGKQRMIKAEK